MNIYWLLPFFILFSFLLLSISVQAQVIPDVLGQDVVEAANVDCFCSPGIRNKSRSRGLELAYQFTGSSVFEEEKEPLLPPLSELEHLNRLILKLKAPVLLKDDLKILIGTSYRPETYSISRVGTDYQSEITHLNDEVFKSTSFSAIVSKSIDSTHYAVLRVKARFNGDYDGFVNFDKRYTIYTFYGAYGFKPSDDLEWGFGLSASTGFRRKFIAFPFFIYNRNFNTQWGIEAMLPAVIKLRYNHSPKTIFSGGINYSSRTYSIGVDRDPLLEGNPFSDYHFRHAELQGGIEVEQQIVPWVWLNVKTGYQKNFTTEFEGINGNDNDFLLSPTGSPFFRIGLFISPPDSFK